MKGSTGLASANRRNATMASRTTTIGVIHHAFSCTMKSQNSARRLRWPEGSCGSSMSGM
jgi:hypothetical protein